jgi:uncharacterized membrane protein YraQ (UPF0718 family)
MKWAIVIFLGILLSVVGLAAWQGRLEAGLRATARSAVEIGPILVLAIVIMGFTEVLLPQGWVERWLTDASGPRGLLVAWLAGVLTPGGSIIGFPLAAGLLKTGASPAVVVTYLTSMALLNVLRLPMEAGTYGLRMAALRVLACVLLPFLAGGMARVFAPLMRLP